ncbi:Uncharacterized membrane protein YsdA, DUF1294 family [Halopseudomonas sabulinigri]|uniref:Uncharacterized membrane protein YsdA, DUF1294 family n=1 Tax=Halopseudomonas sabulinigri TaxID=472181 RepID=A0A1H1U7H4_9GAMM|nr:DUF1294 domain-containing protein [Halopseudomonas sabulinigri]SDS68303.1 Uncharacterized membrane protein YsdA, DUF1294 family [Halopseudomonas sabulinigri]
MELRGKLINWNDDKGFGFIQPADGSERLFVHISAVRGDSRPTAGSTVYYLAGQDERGRPRAEHMRGEGLSIDRAAIRRKPQASEKGAAKKPRSAPARVARPRRTGRPQAGIRQLPLKLLVLALLLVLPLLGSLNVLTRQAALWPLMAYLLVCIASFLQYAIDKRRAESGRWRTPENTLHITELLGGWPGALIAQQVFRHKTRKVPFQVVFWLIVLLHQAFWFDWLLLGARYSGSALQQLGLIGA